MLFELDNKIISSEIFKRKFVCDLSSCKGACCIEGDGGAPLKLEEVENIEKNLPEILNFLDVASINSIENNGFYHKDSAGEFATNLMSDGSCVFVFRNELGHLSCGIEQAYREEKINMNKPISCHLYPIRVKKIGDVEALNYEEWSICTSACILGASQNIRVYEFLKEPLIRAYGEAFYNELNSLKQEILNEIEKGS